MGDQEQFLSLRAAARRYRLSPGRLRAAIRAGELPAYRPGKRWVRVWEPEVVAWFRSQRVPVPTGAEDHVRRRLAELEEEGR